jgi:hypothetical protein
VIEILSWTPNNRIADNNNDDADDDEAGIAAKPLRSASRLLQLRFHIINLLTSIRHI